MTSKSTELISSFGWMGTVCIRNLNKRKWSNAICGSVQNRHTKMRCPTWTPHIYSGLRSALFPVGWQTDSWWCEPIKILVINFRTIHRLQIWIMIGGLKTRGNKCRYNKCARLPVSVIGNHICGWTLISGLLFTLFFSVGE